MQLLIQANSGGTHPSSWPNSTPGDGRVWVGASFNSTYPQIGYVLGNKEPGSHQGSHGTLVPLGISVFSGALFGES